MKNFFNTIRTEIRKQYQALLKSKKMFIMMTLFPILEFCLLYGRYLPFKDNVQTLVIDNVSFDYFSFFLIGYIGFMLFQSVILAGWLYSKERIMGTLELVYLTPANRLGLLIGNAFVGIIQNSWMSLIFSILIIIFIPNSLNLNFIKTIIIIPLFLIPSIAWGTLTNSLMLFSRNNNSILSIMERPISILSGVEIPLNILPNWIQTLSCFIPLTYSIKAIRTITIANMALKTITFEIIMSLAYSVLIIIIAGFLCKKAEKHLKKTGSLTFF
ncbi:MAG: ABC-type polysaccharide/polyol phosphate export system, permease component [Clostridiaceae bacterium]|jgi:ABC-2 type transport system permease protein|nr:ABC-type polysaccharide/polyol phosphate export system, permease component [Clostridiaceae bacterium]